MNRLLVAAVVGLLGLTGRLAVAGPPKSPDEDLRAERDALLAKIVKGEEFEKSIERFAALLRERQQRQDAVAGTEADQKAREAGLKADRQGLDYSVGENCQLFTDPNNPPQRSRAFMHADWGRVIDKRDIRIPAAHPFDEDEKLVMYKVQGTRMTYTISGKGPHLWFDRPLTANKGDLVLVCIVSIHDEGSGSKYPPDFRDNILSQGFAAPIKEPPLIAKKRNPIHIPGRESGFAHVIHSGRWDYPEGQSVLSHLLIKQDLGAFGAVRRFSVYLNDRGDEYVLEVPVKLKNLELLKPYKYAWVIMGQARLDRELKKLVLVAEDIEAHYITPLY